MIALHAGGHVLVDPELDGFPLVLLDLNGEGLRAPWSEVCEGCNGSGVAHAGERLVGPCASCWGLGRVVFAFHVDEPCAASVVPAVVASRWLFDRSAECSCVASARDRFGSVDAIATGECEVHG